jgi:pimeloyl-ACP methyl ester carboxylesterase
MRTIREWGARLVSHVLDYVYAVRVLLGLTTRHRAAPRPRGDKAPVLLVPGVYEPWQFLRAVGGRLARAGHPVHVIEPLGYNRAPVPDAAALAQRYLDEHGLTGVIVVAHSKGGLIGKHMMLVDDVAGRIDRLVAIASPFSGSSFSRYMPTRALRAFDPRESTLAMLMANAEVNARIVSIYGIFDPHIPIGSELAGATNVQLPVYGHFRLLADPRVLDEVEAAVEGSETAARDIRPEWNGDRGVDYRHDP